VTTAHRLLNSIDGLSYGARQRLLATTARSLGERELSALLDELDARDGFARLIGLQLAYVAGERGYVERCLTAAEPAVARRALGAAVRLGLPAEVFVRRLPELPTALRAGLYQEVRRRRVTELAETLLPAVRSRFGDVEAAVLLPASESATVAALLPELGYAVTGWRMIGHRHPKMFLDHLDGELAAAPRSSWGRLLDGLGSGLAAAALHEPDRVLAVLTQTAPHAQVPFALARTIGLLARHDPARLLRVLLDPRRPGDAPGGRALWRALLGASDDELVGFARALRGHHFPRFLRQVPPSRRAAVYAGVVGRRDLTLSELPITALDELPAADRTAEAERLLPLRRVADDTSTRLAVTARLPWSQAVETLREATRRSTAEERAEGYRLLIRAAALSRDQDTFAELLGMLNRLRNDQDPVRAAAFEALAEVPPWLYRAAEAPAVLTLLTDAVQARDCSWQTSSCVRKLVGRMLRHGVLSAQPELVETAMEALARLGDKRPHLNLYNLDVELPRGGEHQVFEALRPRLEADARRGRFDVTLALAGGLHRRAWRMPALQALLDQARHAADDHTVRCAIELWLAPRETRDERVGEVFAADRSTITFPTVLAGIGFRRTDLLDDVFGKPLHGRFLKRGVKLVPHFAAACFSRWLPRQCAVYAELLGRAAEPRRKQQTYERVRAVQRLAGVPGAIGILRSYVDDDALPVAEAALAGLAWTDEPAEVLDDLLAHVDDDKARIAVYAVTRCARFVRPGRLGDALHRVLTSKKVTSRKEAVRLLAAHHAPDAARTLASVWYTADQHRDVLRAVVSAARWCLPGAWPLLTEAASAEHAVATAVLELDPYTLAPAHRERYASLIHTVADAESNDTARVGLLTLARWARWDPAGTRMLVGRLADLANTANWREALTALVAGCAATEDPAPLVDAAARLLSTSDTGGADRDLPARQRIQAVAGEVRRYALKYPSLRVVAEALSRTLATDPTLRGPTIELATTAIGFEPDGDARAALDRVGSLADSPRWGWHAHTAVRTQLRRLVKKLPQAHLYELASSAPPMMGLAVASEAGPEAGWPQHWRAFVTGLREHDDAEVRLAALDVYTTRE
jgi:hypothetical protein